MPGAPRARTCKASHLAGSLAMPIANCILRSSPLYSVHSIRSAEKPPIIIRGCGINNQSPLLCQRAGVSMQVHDANDALAKDPSLGGDKS